MNNSIQYLQSVQRRIPARVRLILILLYVCVVVFALVGTMMGFFWGALSVATLLLAWYLRGTAGMTYNYRLDGAMLLIERVSGFRTRPKTEEFGVFDLRRMKLMAEEGDPALEELEALTAAASPRRVRYDVTSHDPKQPAWVFYAEGVRQEEGRWVRVRFEPDAQMRQCIRLQCPGRLKEREA